MRAACDATLATPGEWQCGVRRLAVANGSNIFQMLLVIQVVQQLKAYATNPKHIYKKLMEFKH